MKLAPSLLLLFNLIIKISLLRILSQDFVWHVVISAKCHAITTVGIFYCFLLRRCHHSLSLGSSQSLLIPDMSGLRTSQSEEHRFFLFLLSSILARKIAVAFTVSLKTHLMRSWLLDDWLLASLSELSFAFV